MLWRGRHQRSFLYVPTPKRFLEPFVRTTDAWKARHGARPPSMPCVPATAGAWVPTSSAPSSSAHPLMCLIKNNFFCLKEKVHSVLPALTECSGGVDPRAGGRTPSQGHREPGPGTLRGPLRLPCPGTEFFPPSLVALCGFLLPFQGKVPIVQLSASERDWPMVTDHSHAFGN